MFVYRLFMFNLHYLAQIKQNYTDFKHRQSMLLHALAAISRLVLTIVIFIIVIFKWFNIKLLFTLQRYDDYVGYENENSYT